jgi:TPR repeat protein
MNPPLVAETVIPGGPELAAQAGLYRGDLFAEPERRACEDGTLRSCYVLGARYVKGDGVARDPARAAPLLARACEGGLAGACLDLGELYATGAGVPVDAAHARTLYDKACRGGEPFACERMKEP